MSKHGKRIDGTRHAHETWLHQEELTTIYNEVQGCQQHVLSLTFDSPTCRNEALNLGKAIDLLLRDHPSVWGSPALEVLTRRLIAVLHRDRDGNWDVADKILDVQARPLVASLRHLEAARKEAKLEWLLAHGKQGFEKQLDRLDKDQV